MCFAWAVLNRGGIEVVVDLQIIWIFFGDWSFVSLLDTPLCCRSFILSTDAGDGTPWDGRFCSEANQIISFPSFFFIWFLICR